MACHGVSGVAGCTTTRWMSHDSPPGSRPTTTPGPAANGWRTRRASLSAHYEVQFDSVGINLYRDGADSVAWHRDRIPADIVDPVVALVSLGHPRTLLLRPHGGGRSRAFKLGRGDLLVTGGQTQRRFEHSVPKVKESGPRISLAFRHGLR